MFITQRWNFFCSPFLFPLGASGFDAGGRRPHAVNRSPLPRTLGNCYCIRTSSVGLTPKAPPSSRPLSLSQPKQTRSGSDSADDPLPPGVFLPLPPQNLREPLAPTPTGGSHLRRQVSNLGGFSTISSPAVPHWHGRMQVFTRVFLTGYIKTLTNKNIDKGEDGTVGSLSQHPLTGNLVVVEPLPDHVSSV